MTIASEISRITNNIADAYTACSGKGATLPATQNSANLADCIDSISGGGGVGIPREVSAQGVYQVPASSFTFSLPSNATNLGEYALLYALYGSDGLTSVDCSSLTTINGYQALAYAFCYCRYLTSVDFSSLTTLAAGEIFKSAFTSCLRLTSVDFPSLTTIAGNSCFGSAFSSCTNLTSVDFSSLITIQKSNTFASAFSFSSNLSNVKFDNLQTIGTNDTVDYDGAHFSAAFSLDCGVQTLSFPNLETIYCTGSNSAGTFYSCSGIQKMYFPKLTTITYATGITNTNRQAGCKNIFYNCSRLTELHFGAANQAAIEASAGYSTAWGRGAGNVTIYFDL